MNTGKYNGQLVIGNELIPIVPFEIDFLSEMVFLIAERGIIVLISDVF